jgi:glycosyltransferase involved in cell wall biosynthesis
LRILTWHVHGNYLYYLTQVPHVFYVLVNDERSPGYSGVCGNLPWGDNVIELPISRVRETEFDCILFQSRATYENDRHKLLSEAQLKLPKIYIEHDTPQEHPSNTRHHVDDPNVMLVHVTAFNRTMWDNGACPTRVVDHGVTVPSGARYAGNLPRGISVVNNIAKRGRRLGRDIFEEARLAAPLDLVGMGAEEIGGLGEIENPELPFFMAQYRFYFHPVRWTSLGLSAIEAMMVGLPIIGFAATELVTVIRNGESGYLDTEPANLVACMRELIANPDLARQLGEGARREAEQRFNIDRFIHDWLRVFTEATQ